MMKDVPETAGRANMQRFLSFAVYNDGTQQWMHLDINRWLSAMSDYVRTEVKKVINENMPGVLEAVKSGGSLFTCQEPN